MLELVLYDLVRSDDTDHTGDKKEKKKINAVPGAV